jgi:hypothetical protein
MCFRWAYMITRRSHRSSDAICRSTAAVAAAPSPLQSHSMSAPSGSGQTAAAAGQQSESVRGRIGLGAGAGGFDADLYGGPDEEEKREKLFAREIAADDEDEDMGTGR